MARPRILFLDAYDSFTNNIVSLLTTVLDADVKVLHIDDLRFDHSSPTFDIVWRKELSHFDALVCGPGPGSPSCEADVGLMKWVWGLGEDAVIPVLGICLGFQSLLCHFGARIRRLKGGLHGMIREIQYQQIDGGGLFADVQPFKATLYHSLCIDIGQDPIPPSDWPERRWQPFSRSPDMVPLAWVEENRGEDDVERILMAVRHRNLPFWGLQYHPESVCTGSESEKIIWNWFQEALRWNRAHSRTTDPGVPLAHFCVSPSHLAAVNDVQQNASSRTAPSWIHSGRRLSKYGLGCTLEWKTIELPSHILVPDLVEILGGSDGDQVVLDSSNYNIPLPKSAVDVRGRYSIVALDVRNALQLQYRAGDDGIKVEIPGRDISDSAPLQGHYETFWEFASDFLRPRRIDPPEGHDSPFLGGFMGYVSYEMGLSHLGIQLSRSRSVNRPDINWVWVTRSLVIDHAKGVVYIQQLRPAEGQDENWEESLFLERREGEQWLDSIADRLRSSSLWECPPGTKGMNLPINGHVASKGFTPEDGHNDLHVNLPSKKDYMSKVKQCQDYIARGESYELCLTNEVQITLPTRSVSGNSNGTISDASNPRDATPWNLFKSLRKRQPAPFGSYLRLGPTAFVSSSPERFLSCSREGVCFMHPMKGTAKKSESVRTLGDAEKLLRVPKEEAENLMIVDLVRHDLHSVCGPGNVDVPKLMQIEEYASVFQMITVVKGVLPRAEETGREYTALDALSASLPPGSMTGAPKKRSCEILQGVEGYRERGVYSGVTGYMDVSGKADWSVNIRCLFRYDDECAPECERHCSEGCGVGDVWHVGAGGAVTTLSTPEGECEEMFAKLEGSLGLFGVQG